MLPPLEVEDEKCYAVVCLKTRKERVTFSFPQYMVEWGS